jgi:hypothetical protein
MDQFTAVLLDPVTVALSVVDCPPVRDAEAGDTETDTDGAGGTSEIVALALLDASAALVAFTVTVCAEAIVAGAV